MKVKKCTLDNNAIVTSGRTKSQRGQEGIQNRAEDSGVEGLVWHDLRATFWTRLGEAGFDAFTIAAQLGHSDIHTMARYVGATERNKRAAVEAAMLGSKEVVHKLATRPLALAAVSC